MSDTKHTQPPWKVRQAYLNGEPCNYTIHTGMTTIADCFYDEQGEAEANHIVRCVNAHDEMKAILRDFLVASDNLNDGQVDPDKGESERDFIEVREIARQFLAKLEGGAK